MQTFLPSACFAEAAALLDDRRLGKQRVETLQILRALVWPTYGWKRHPAVAMWRGFTAALVHYGVVVCDEWRSRGHRDNVRSMLLEYTGGDEPTWPHCVREGLLPPWLGDPGLHRSHRSVLLQKEPDHYSQLFSDVPAGLSYTWPQPVFPRWPMSVPTPISFAEASALVGVDATEKALSRVKRLVDDEATDGDRDLALVAGLCTPGLTAWFVDCPPLSPARPAAHPMVEERGEDQQPGKSIARPPTPADLAAVQAEIHFGSQFRFLRAGQPLPEPVDRFGLVVVSEQATAPVKAGKLPVLRVTGHSSCP